MTRINVLLEAETEIAEAFKHYRFISADLGARFRMSLETALDHIGDFPQAHAVFVASARRCRISQFPYSLLYVEQEVNGDEEVIIVACVHERSNPQNWRVNAFGSN